MAQYEWSSDRERFHDDPAGRTPLRQWRPVSLGGCKQITVHQQRLWVEGAARSSVRMRCMTYASWRSLARGALCASANAYATNMRCNCRARHHRFGSEIRERRESGCQRATSVVSGRGRKESALDAPLQLFASAPLAPCQLYTISA